ncbi:Asp/Glu/hydantoin racemase [Pseudonocardia thermophila]|jgi:Hydantoin racemase|uniref:Asp/Glu/hydantoin racemase n=1 Tax=Pseudonocardia thermophila TaxID=1848 RepID=A0A1M6XIZ1_PSETH|nr:aspartate/glutamate racemase family protein [Pseudonocardia thermophila]SHL05878.1 Asp/Glu/hydantoin racemase [Pseudonocardia thermophila]
MGTRIWYQTMTDVDTYPTYRAALEAHARRVLGPESSVAVHGVAPGTYAGQPPVTVLKYPYSYHVLLEQVIGNVLRAQAEGFDAVVLGSYSEPFLREARCAVEIPIASMAEATLLVGCSVAARAALISVTDDIAYMAERLVDKHHLRDRVACVRRVDPPVNEQELLAMFADPAEFVELFTAQARAVIAERADVIIPAEGVLNELLVEGGLQEVDGVCVMDCVGVSLLYAEMLVKLHRHTGLHPGRRWEYPLAPPAVTALLAEHAARIPLSAAAARAGLVTNS